MSNHMQNRWPSWPLYLVVSSSTHGEFGLSVPRDKMAFVTGSFAFARLLAERLRSHLSEPLYILRVVYYNRFNSIMLQANKCVARLDRAWAWSSPPSVFSASYCQLCLKSSLTSCALEVTVSPDPGSACPVHRLEWAPQYFHERLKLNTLYHHWEKFNTAGVLAALRSAKTAWIGPLYFARTMRKVLPLEVMDIIVSAVICQY